MREIRTSGLMSGDRKRDDDFVSTRAYPRLYPGFYCGGGYGHVYCVALGRAPRRSVNYASGALGRAPCIHAHLHHLATNPGEKCGLAALPYRGSFPNAAFFNASLTRVCQPGPVAL